MSESYLIGRAEDLMWELKINDPTLSLYKIDPKLPNMTLLCMYFCGKCHPKIYQKWGFGRLIGFIDKKFKEELYQEVLAIEVKKNLVPILGGATKLIIEYLYEDVCFKKKPIHSFRY
jgi:hypothetical protein